LNQLKPTPHLVARVACGDDRLEPGSGLLAGEKRREGYESFELFQGGSSNPVLYVSVRSNGIEPPSWGEKWLARIDPLTHGNLLEELSERYYGNGTSAELAGDARQTGQPQMARLSVTNLSQRS
jgi:hypothetical protein